LIDKDPFFYDKENMIKFERLPADIILRLDGIKKLLIEDENIIFAYLFGGLAKGDVHPLSDIDLAVYLKYTDELAPYKLQLFDKITDVIGTSEMDLIILNTAPISLIGRILQSRQVLVDKEPYSRHVFESLKLREFFDFRIKEDSLFLRRYGLGR
jgi:predicted nucleotidyltransferase